MSASSPFKTVGVLGGGQLGRMLAQAAHSLGCRIVVLDPDAQAPAAAASDEHLVGSFRDPEAVARLAKMVDLLTVEIEHVDTVALERAAAATTSDNSTSTTTTTAKPVQPTPQTIRLIQDKFLQKQHLAAHRSDDTEDNKVSLGEFAEIRDAQQAREVGHRFGYPFMLKAKTMAYDGRGNVPVRSEDELDAAISAIGGFQIGLYAEKWVPFKKELAVMVARALDGQIVSYPVVETIQRDSICHKVIAPALISTRAAIAAKKVAENAIRRFSGAGIFGVELFLLEDDSILLNEIAPRPHNSGHYTIEACHTSQFEQHLRCILGLPLGDPSLRVGGSVMLNVIGDQDPTQESCYAPCLRALSEIGASVHWYGKTARKGRKMGHITVCASRVQEALAIVERIEKGGQSSSSSIAAAAASVVTSTIQARPPPIVGIIMGSDSDLNVMKAAAEVLRDFGVPFEVSIVSAHRTPRRLIEYASEAARRGLRVIIAGAGGAAHLPGMVAAVTPLPVIGVPVALRHLGGLDSLASIVQMPRGVPVATVAVDNSTNAGLLAVRMLATGNAELLIKMERYMADMESSVLQKVDRLDAIGWENYKA